jgi:hypothetical protein
MWTRRQVLAQIGLAVIMTSDGVVVVDSHSKPSALGRHRDRVGSNVEAVHQKVIRKA